MPQLAGPNRPSRAAGSRRLQPPPRRFYALVAAVSGILGATVFGASLLSTWVDARVLAWPTTTGRLTAVEIRYDTVGVFVLRRANVPMRQRRFHVRYAYIVGGTSYLGSQIAAHAADAQVNGQRERYGVGQAVTVHYHQTAPSEAVIETPFPFGSVLGVGIGLLLLVGARRANRLRARLSGGRLQA